MGSNGAQTPKIYFPRVGKVIRAASLLALVLVFALKASGEEPGGAATTERELIQQLLVRLQSLEAEVQELKARQAEAILSTPASPLAAASQNESESGPQPKPSPQRGDEKALHQESPEASAEMPTERPNLEIRGFGDFGFHVTNQKGDTNSFSLNQFDLFLKSRLTDKFSVASDIIIDDFTKNAFEIDLERLVLQYAPNDWFNVSFGRFLTGIGYYNFAFQHANWFQTTIGRPFIFEFDDHGGVLPTHMVGLTASGLIPSGRLGLHYLAEVGNGRALRGDEPTQNFIDENNRKAVNLGLFVRPDWLAGLQAGFSVYRDRLVPEGLPKVDQTITAMHIVYVKPNFELLNEGLLVRHAPVGGGRVFTAAAFYTQVSRRFFGKYRPYFRYEYLNVPEGIPVIGDVGRRNSVLGGIRIDLNQYTALKLQFDHGSRRGFDTFNRFSTHFAFTF